MKRFLILISATTAILGLSAVTAQAAPWKSINKRQSVLDRRIDQGVRSGELTRAEAARLRTEFRELTQREARYRKSGNGLSNVERRDLDRRFDALAKRVHVRKTNRYDRR
ncbi:MAG: hypothetical protein ACK47B_21275 [Armatimonadota bacterium]